MLIIKNDQMLEQLRVLLKSKKSKSEYASKLGITVQEVEKLLEELREENNYNVKGEYISTTADQIHYNMDKGTIEISTSYDHPPTPEEVIKDHKIDSKEYKLSNYWSKAKGSGWFVSAFFTKLSKVEESINNFEEFLQTYRSQHTPVKIDQVYSLYNKACLILNKQDAHLNKYDIDGKNDIIERFTQIREKTLNILTKASVTCKLEKIVYVIGSDQFNSEWTGTTTKGTPQQNILPYQVAFQAICDHETQIINMLLRFSKVEVIYMPGNHDEYVGFHMVSWLKAFYRNQDNLDIDISSDYTKYISYSNTAICLNHGDAQKPEKLAQNFPIEYKRFSLCNHHIILTGDKHSEISRHIGGIKFYQIPALSTSKSLWDSKNGYTTTKAEMNAFLIEEGEGMTAIYKQTL